MYITQQLYERYGIQKKGKSRHNQKSFDEERNARGREEDILGLKTKEPRQLEYIEESPEAHTPEERKTLEAEESPEAHTSEERKTLEAEESPEALTPEERDMPEAEETPEGYTPEEQKMLEAEEYPEAHTPEEQKMLETEESPEAHTPEEQKMLEASETTDSAAGSQDGTDEGQARARRREFHCQNGKKDRNKERSSAQKKASKQEE